MNASYNSKQSQILVTGKELFWKYGFKRVTVEEICREAGVSKMTFYKYFPNKIRLAMTILDTVFDETLEKIHSLKKLKASPEKILNKIIELKAEGTQNISEEFIRDLYTNPEKELKEYMDEKTRLMFGEMIGIYEKGKKDGWVRQDLNVPFFILFIQESINLFSKDEFIHFFDTSQEMIMEITRLFVYGLSPHK